MGNLDDYNARNDSAPMDEHGVVHGVTAEGLARHSCGWEKEDTFKCRKCERTICYCMGHDDCHLCDECCSGHTIPW